jgi:hypothetical protein
MNPFVPNLEQIHAAGNQSDFYIAAWEEDRASLQAYYLEQLKCSDVDSTCRSDAFNLSINEATGSSFCSVNAGGTAWFWFTGKRKKIYIYIYICVCVCVCVCVCFGD